MSLYQCQKCGCKENTAVGHYWRVPESEQCCSFCATGKWHGHFPRVMLPKGMFITNSVGNLQHKETGDTDLSKYILETVSP